MAESSDVVYLPPPPPTLLKEEVMFDPFLHDFDMPSYDPFNTSDEFAQFYGQDTTPVGNISDDQFTYQDAGFIDPGSVPQIEQQARPKPIVFTDDYKKRKFDCIIADYCVFRDFAQTLS